MLKSTFFKILYVALIVGIIAFMIFMVSWLQGESRDCLNNPIEWFEEKNKGSSCSCYKDGAMFGAVPNGENININIDWGAELG